MCSPHPINRPSSERTDPTKGDSLTYHLLDAYRFAVWRHFGRQSRFEERSVDKIGVLCCLSGITYSTAFSAKVRWKFWLKRWLTVSMLIASPQHLGGKRLSSLVANVKRLITQVVQYTCWHGGAMV